MEEVGERIHGKEKMTKEKKGKGKRKRKRKKIKIKLEFMLTEKLIE